MLVPIQYLRLKYTVCITVFKFNLLTSKHFPFRLKKGRYCFQVENRYLFEVYIVRESYF